MPWAGSVEKDKFKFFFFFFFCQSLNFVELSQFVCVQVANLGKVAKSWTKHAFYIFIFFIKGVVDCDFTFLTLVSV